MHGWRVGGIPSKSDSIENFDHIKHNRPGNPNFDPEFKLDLCLAHNEKGAFGNWNFITSRIFNLKEYTIFHP